MEEYIPNDYTQGDYLRTFDEDWRDIVCDKNGRLKIDQVARELHDYSLLMHCTSIVYDHIANLSKPFTCPEVIVDAINESIRESAEELVKERYQELLDRIAELEGQ